MIVRFSNVCYYYTMTNSSLCLFLCIYAVYININVGDNDNYNDNSCRDIVESLSGQRELDKLLTG